MSGQLILFDIPSKDPNNRCWSFNPWKTRLVLNYKGIDYKTEWLDYPDIEGRLKPTGLEGDPEEIKPYTCPTVQFLDGTYIMNSRKIIRRLEADYPEKPLNVDSELTQASMDLVDRLWGALAPNALAEIVGKVLPERSAEYFRETRKEILGMSIDDFYKARGGEQAWERAKQPLEDAVALLNNTEGPFFHGKEASYADFLYVSFIFACKNIDEKNYERIIAHGDALDKLYRACEPWLERRNH